MLTYQISTIVPCQVDLNKKAGLSQKVIDYLDELGSLPDLPDKAQLSIFDM
jgi:DNA polymerase-3 subunit alpha (Gram-positive type)